MNAVKIKLDGKGEKLQNVRVKRKCGHNYRPCPLFPLNLGSFTLGKTLRSQYTFFQCGLANMHKTLSSIPAQYKPGVLVHCCNPSQGGEDREIRSSMPARDAVDHPSKHYTFHRREAFPVNLKYAKKKNSNNPANVDESQKCNLSKGQETPLTGLLASKDKPCLQCLHLHFLTP